MASTVLFDFHPDDGPVEQVTIPGCPDDLYEALLHAAAGHDGDQVFTINGCEVAGGYGTYHFRAARIRNVREVP